MIKTGSRRQVSIPQSRSSNRLLPQVERRKPHGNKLEAQKRFRTKGVERSLVRRSMSARTTAMEPNARRKLDYELNGVLAHLIEPAISINVLLASRRGTTYEGGTIFGPSRQTQMPRGALRYRDAIKFRGRFPLWLCRSFDLGPPHSLPAAPHEVTRSLARLTRGQKRPDHRFPE